MKVKKLLYRNDILFSAIILLSVVALFLLFVVVRDVFSHFSDFRSEKVLSNTEVLVDSGLKPFKEYGIILEKNPFGFNAGLLVPLTSHPEITRTPYPETSLKLIGTVVAGAYDSFAIFRSAEGKQFLYRVKSEVPGLGILERVEKDRVFLREGAVKELEIVEIKGNGGSVRGRNVSSGLKDQFVRRVDDSSYVLNGRMVQESINNPQRLMTDARLLPRYVNGQQEGFVLKEVKSGGIYDSLGLRDGDVLLRVNEYNITDPESALQAFTALKGVDRLQLDIARNNSTMSLTYHIK